MVGGDNDGAFLFCDFKKKIVAGGAGGFFGRVF